MFGMQLKWGINIYLLASKYTCSLGMSEDSIFMLNVEQYLLHSRWNRLPKTCLYCLIFKYICFGDEKKFTVNSVFNIHDASEEEFKAPPPPPLTALPSFYNKGRIKGTFQGVIFYIDLHIFLHYDVYQNFHWNVDWRLDPIFFKDTGVWTVSIFAVGMIWIMTVNRLYSAILGGWYDG